MKINGKETGKRFLVLMLSLAISVGCTPALAFAGDEAAADEDKAASEITVKETSTDSSEKEEKTEEKTEKAVEVKTESSSAEAKPESAVSTVSGEDQSNSTSDSNAAADKNTAADATESASVTKADAVSEEVKTEAKAAVVPAKTISVKYNFYQKDAEGNYVSAKIVSRSVTAGKSTTKITLATANTYVKNTKFSAGDNMVTEFTKTWKGTGGSDPSFPLTMTYEEAAEKTEDGKNVTVDLYAQYSTHPSSVNVTVKYSGIMSSSGAVEDKASTSSINWGDGTSMGLKKLESATGVVKGNSMYADFTYKGVKYEYTGEWTATDSLGNTFTVGSATTISIRAKDGESSGTAYLLDKDFEITFTPIYKITATKGLDVEYTDNIATGSGSWSNAGKDGVRSDFSTFTHTFTDPSVKSPKMSEHYSFLYWQDDETEDQYKAGESFTVDADDIEEGGVKKVSFHAWWQPSVTVRYTVDGYTADAESFEDISVYGSAAEAFAEAGISYSENGDSIVINGEEFAGWYDAEGNRVSAGEIAGIPEITSDKKDRKVVEVYAKKEITVKAADNTWVYDGTAHSEDGLEITDGNLIGSDEIVSKNSGSITDAGTAVNEISDIAVMRDGKDVTSLYEISTLPGTLTVEKAQLVIETGSGSKVYDGNALTVDEVSVEGLAEADSAAVTATGSQTDVGTSDNTYSIEWGDTKEENYEITEEIGTLKVTAAAAAVTKKTKSDTKTASKDPAPAAAASAAPAAAAAIADNAVPKTGAAAEIKDAETPLAAGSWALINLIAAVLAIAGSLIALLRRKEEEDEDQQYDEDESDNRAKKMFAAKAAGLLAGIASVITFIITEDMSLPMVMTDRFTVVMLIMLAVQILAAALNKKASKLEEEEEEESAEASF